MKGSKMDIKARLIVLFTYGGSQQAFFETVEQAEKVMDEFSAALGKIREYGNDDVSKMFKFKGAGAIYTLDLRKAACASVEIMDEWGPINTVVSLKVAGNYKKQLREMDEAGLKEENDRIESLQGRMFQ